MGDFNRDKNRAVWFDMPVIDLDRATAFYAGVLDVAVRIDTFGDVRFAVIAHEDGNGGCLVVRPDEVAADRGVLLYLNAHGRLRDAVAKTDTLGGRVVEEIHPIGPHGFCATILDSEGNRLALHSQIDA